MTKLIPTLLLAMSFGPLATAYEMNQNSFVMVREALQKGPKPAMADCSLPEDFGVIINNPSTYPQRAQKCLGDIKKIKSAKEKISASCATLEGMDVLENESAETIGMSLNEMKKSLTEVITSQVKAVQAAPAVQKDEALFISSALCEFTLESDKNESEEGIPFVGLIKGSGESATMSVIKVGK